MKHDFSNEFNLNDPVDREVAIWRASTIDSDIKDLKSKLEWFKVNFRIFFASGGEQNGSHGSEVKVTKPNKAKYHLNTDMIKNLYPVDEYPEYYIKDDNNELKKTTKAQSVTFKLKK